MSDSLLVAFAP